MACFAPPKKPLIAAVEGYCYAGGTEILQATDIRVAGESAKFGVSEPKWGLYPLGGSAVRLVRQLPYTVAADLLLTGRAPYAHASLAAAGVTLDAPPLHAGDVVRRLRFGTQLDARPIATARRTGAYDDPVVRDPNESRITGPGASDPAWNAVVNWLKPASNDSGSAASSVSPA